MKDVEIEIKVRVSDPTRLLTFLQDKAKFVGEKHQIDEYFNAPHRDFTAGRPVNEWLRLRTSGHAAITYKFWHYDKAHSSLYADEFETGVDDVATMRKIFLALNFTALVTVEKNRRIWHYQEYEISLDSVKGLGDFIEIEYTGKNTHATPKTITDGMIKFLTGIGCGTMERSHQGYAMMRLHPDETRLERV